MHELKTWATLADHENVARLSDFGNEFGVPVLLLEYAAFGNLAEYIDRRQKDAEMSGQGEEAPCGTAPWLQEPLDWCIQIASGLQFLHDSCVVHCDIKPQSESTCRPESSVS